MQAATSSKPVPLTTEEKIRRLQAEVTRIQQVAELKALEKQLAVLAKDNDPDVQTETGYAERLVDDIKQDLLSSPTCATSSSKRLRSPGSYSQDDSPSKRQRCKESLSDDDDGVSERATSSANDATERNNNGHGSLQLDDVKWLHENAEKYRGVGKFKRAISWIHLLADNRSLAERMSAHDCARAWNQHLDYSRDKERQRAMGPARLQPKDVEWLHENVERYRGLGRDPKDISWAHVLADNEDLAARMSRRGCSIAWKVQLAREKRPNARRGRKAKQKEPPADNDEKAENETDVERAGREDKWHEALGEEEHDVDSSDEADEVEDQLFL